jgi:hypothetical protein
MRKVRIDMTGARFGRLLGVAYSHSAGGHAHWLFDCDCGNQAVIKGASVRHGNTQSCGCIHREISAQRLLKHGYRAKRRHGPSYRAWQEINTLCANPAAPRFPDFGGRGIAVCPAWRLDFEAFLGDMGERPDGTILRLIDPAAGFCAVNCRWEPRPAGVRGAAKPRLTGSARAVASDRRVSHAEVRR